MAKPRNGSPPKKVAAPPDNGTATTQLTSAAQSSCSAPEWRRRRAASRRLAIQDSGRGDPWKYDDVPLTEHQVECWQRTVAHLTKAGLRPIIPAEVLEVLR